MLLDIETRIGELILKSPRPKAVIRSRDAKGRITSKAEG